MPVKAKQYTVRNVPSSVDRALRRKAAERGASLNDVLLAALEREAGVGQQAITHHDLDALIGSWVEDPAVDAALLEARRVDPRDWE
jgi:plasmid stability protein